MSDNQNFVSENKQQTLHGKVIKFLFPEEGSPALLKNGDKVFLFKEELKPQIKVRGLNFPMIHRGDVIDIKGFYEIDEHGYDVFTAYAIKTKGTKPEYRDGTREYLCRIDGIGPALAEKLMEACGKNIIEKMQKDPKSCPMARSILPENVYARFLNRLSRSTPEKNEAMQFMLKNGLSSLFADRIWRKYREDTVKTIKENPYTLIKDILNFPFDKADDLAAHIKFDMNSPYRIEAAAEYSMARVADDNGHAYFSMASLANMISVMKPRISSTKISSVLQSMIKKGTLIKDKIDGVNVVYTAESYEAEADGAALLKDIIKSGKSLKLSKKKIDEIAEKSSLDDDQKDAVKAALQSSVSVITGGPGTGKSTVMKAIIEALDMAGMTDIALCSFTGKAARRMEEVTGRKALTIHRLLEWNWHEATFHRNKDNPFETQAVIIDEASMVNASLFHSLLSALPQKTKIVLIGDVNQLPAIGPGNVLRDCISSGVIPVTYLKTIHRRSKTDTISVNAAHILAGEPLETSSTFSMFDFRDSKEIIKQIIKTASSENIKKSQVLTPMKKYDFGTTGLNPRLQAILNPQKSGKKEITFNGFTYRVGDKVMQMKNDYNLEVMNGEWGFITAITDTKEEKIVKVCFDGTFGEKRAVEYDLYSLFNLRPAYACTIHKTQGSEYESVIIALPAVEMLNKNLIYTAVTRAKKKVTLIGNIAAVNEAIKHNVVENRNSAFDKRLRGEL